MSEVQITRGHPMYDVITGILGSECWRVPDERGWFVTDERPHFEVEVFEVDEVGNPMTKCELAAFKAGRYGCECVDLTSDEHCTLAIQPVRRVIWID